MAPWNLHHWLVWVITLSMWSILGNTLRANGLEPLEEICKVSSRLIVNKASFKRKQALLNPILAQLEKAVEEREQAKQA